MVLHIYHCYYTNYIHISKVCNNLITMSTRSIHRNGLQQWRHPDIYHDYILNIIYHAKILAFHPNYNLFSSLSKLVACTSHRLSNSDIQNKSLPFKGFKCTIMNTSGAWKTKLSKRTFSTVQADNRFLSKQYEFWEGSRNSKHLRRDLSKVRWYPNETILETRSKQQNLKPYKTVFVTMKKRKILISRFIITFYVLGCLRK